MATRKEVGKRRPTKPAARQPESVDDDLALAEELLHPPSPEDQAAIERELDKFMKQLGLRGKKPIGAKKLREQMLKRGFDPETNEFSRGIIEMREE